MAADPMTGHPDLHFRMGTRRRRLLSRNGSADFKQIPKKTQKHNFREKTWKIV